VNKIENKEFCFCFGQSKSTQNQNKIRTKLNKIKQNQNKIKQSSKKILIKFDMLNFITNNLQLLNIHGCDFLHQIYMKYNSFFGDSFFY